MQKMWWNQVQLTQLKELIKEGKTRAELAQVFDVSQRAIEAVCARHNLKAPQTLPRRAAPTDLPADLKKADETFWEKSHAELSAKYSKLLREQTVVERLVGQISGLAPRSYDPAPAVRAPHKLSESAPQEAVLHISDSHAGQVVSADQTMFFGNYDMGVFLCRLQYIEDAVRSICTDHVNTPLPALHIAWGGDLLHGDLAHGNEAAHLVTLFEQFYLAAHAFAQFTRNLASSFENVHCWGVVGNHPRWGTQRKMPTINRFSNLDMFVLAMMEALTKNIPNIHWHLSKQPFVEFQVQGWAHHLSHGDHLRGGDRALGVPSHALGRELSVTSQLFAKHGKQPVNYYLHGHFHRPMELPHAAGEILVNGGWPGVDEYALTNHFNPADPQQRLYFVHPVYGRTANYYLSLKHASGAARYSLPSL